ncbi:MAG: carbohydrate ABC transporter permease [Oscillospiraceae bacterium]|jgi:ABC transporter, permease protein|nr:carbohydrate ABC transporter permease [Oscillospiraceae bacterium]
MKFPKNPRRAKLLNRSRAGNVLMFLFLAGFAVYSALPILLIFLQSVKPLNELFIYPPRFFVMNPTFDNFRQLSSLMSSTWVPFIRYIFNSVFVSVTGTVGHIVVASMCAYPLAKMNLKGGNVIFTIIVTSLMFAPTVSDIINYQTISTLGMLDNYLAIILPALGTSLGLYIMKQFMSQIPDALIESAHIDGASTFTVFWKIVMPNVKPAWLTLAIFSFQGLWNNANTTYIYREELKSLPYALNQIVGGGIIRAGAGAAVSVIILMVPLLLFIFTQSRIIETMSTSGMKE